MELHDYDDPVYIISVASDILNIHPQTLRMYEREGLLEPKRTGSNNRMFSMKDLDEVKEIRKLTREEGVNLAGVRIIMKMRREMDLLKSNLKKFEQVP